jgi:signal transduction histidine kinase
MNMELQREIAARERAEMESLAMRNELSAELAAMTQLHDFSTRLFANIELVPLLEEVLSAIMSLQKADFGNIQLYDRETDVLELVVHRGFQGPFLQHFARIPAASRDGGSGCARAVKARARVIIEDVQTDAEFAPHREIAASAGFRAVQSTPLFSRRGELLGMMSTHFREPHRPSERDLRLTDLYASHAAEMIERAQTETAVQRYQQELQALTAKLIEAQEVDSKFLARELHDYFSQKLAVLGMEMAALAHGFRSRPLNEALLDLTAQIGDMAKDIHRISRRLHPAILDDLGLAAALRNECVAFSEQYGVRVELDADEIPDLIPEDIGLCLYRVSQECLRNAVIHANTTEVRLALRREEGEIVMEISDLGGGFDLERCRGKGGLGLISMEERVRLVNGTFKLWTLPGAGTTVEARVPVRRKEA